MGALPLQLSDLPAGSPGDRPDVETVYREYRSMLFHLATAKFGVPVEEAEGLIHEVFVTFLSARSEIRSVRQWLVGAICNASRGYWRHSGRTEPYSPDPAGETPGPRERENAERYATSITIRETLARLQEKCRETLHLRYYEGLSADELARRYETSNKYAAKLVQKCLKRARDIYASLMAGGPTS